MGVTRNSPWTRGRSEKAYGRRRARPTGAGPRESTRGHGRGRRGRGGATRDAVPARRPRRDAEAVDRSVPPPEIGGRVVAPSSPERHAVTTILAVTRDGRSVLGGDGQVTLGTQVQKHGAVKVRALRDGRVLAGFAGGAADAFALLDRFESKLGDAGGQLLKAA